jgi:hypothetical protein
MTRQAVNVVVPEKGDEGVHPLRHAGIQLSSGEESSAWASSSMPCVLEGFDLRLAGVARGGLGRL